jgi:hypothetical protein
MKKNSLLKIVFEFFVILFLVNSIAIFIKWDLNPKSYSWEERSFMIIISVLIFSLLQRSKFFNSLNEDEEEK